MPKHVSILVETEGLTKDAISKLEDKIVSCGFDAILTHVGVRVIEKGTFKYSVAEMQKMENHNRGIGMGVFQEDAIYIFCEYDDEDRIDLLKEIQKEAEAKQKGEVLSDSVYYAKEGTVTLLKNSLLYKKLCKPVKDFRGLSVEVQADQRLQRECFRIPGDRIQKHIVFTHPNTSTEVGWYNLRANILWLSDIAHDPRTFSTIFEAILIKIDELRRFGKFKELPIRIGADPEFEILSDNNQLLPANMFFRFEGKIGTDGHNQTGEIRPDSARSPLELVKNIKRLIRSMNKISALPKDSKICAGGGTKVTTGGHIHFGMKKIPSDAREVLYDLVGKALLSHQTGIRNSSKELVTKEGGDAIRKADAHEGWEWRSPPSWLTSESIATCVLVTTYCVVKALASGPLVIEGSKRAILRSLPLYSTYKEYIEDFINKFYSTTKQVQLEGVSIIPEWNLKPLNGSQNIKIISSNSMAQKFFTPVFYPLSNGTKEVNVEIEFGGNKIAVYGLTEKDSLKLTKLANAHFLDCVIFSNIEEITRYASNEGIPFISVRGDKAIRGTNIFIILPYAWESFTKKRVLFRQIGRMIKDTIVSLNE